MNRTDDKTTTRAMKQRYLFLLGIFISTILGALPAFGQGPVQPEAMQFEPVDVTDVVNLATGDFVYTIPVMSVPGPAGDYPITISYHSGIGPNQPATWVGLGWTLNAGAVNRTLSGYPDDYKGDIVVTEYEAPEQSGRSINIGMGVGPVGINMSYDQNTGKVGVNAMVSVFAALGVKDSPLDVSISYGTDGFNANATLTGSRDLGNDFTGSVSLSAGTNGVGISGGVSKKIYEGYKVHDDNSISLVPTNSIRMISTGTSLLSSGSGGSFTVAGTGFSSVTSSSGGDLDARNVSIPIPLPGGAWISLGFSTWKWSMDETYEEKSYGALYQIDNYGSGNGSIKNERHATEETLFPSVDAYNVAAQGVSGAMQPVFDYSFELIDKVEHDKKGYLDLEYDGSSFDPNDAINFRFLDDLAFNFTNKGSLQLSTARNYSRIDATKYSSKKVEPIIGTESNRIIGYIITMPDGMIYEFLQPVNNLFQYSESVSLDENAVVNFTNKNSLLGSFSTSWFLTAIKGPDYIDRGTAGIVDEADWGYWVKFNYDTNDDLQIWSAPHNAQDPVFDYALGTDGGSRIFSSGIREVVYLSSIETKTHQANFVSSPSKNGQNATIDFSQYDFEPISYALNRSTVSSFTFTGDLTRYLDHMANNEEILHIKHTFYDNDPSYPGYIDCGTNSYITSQLSFSYNPIQDITHITVTNPSTPNCPVYDSDYIDSEAELHITKFLNANANTHVKLEAVELINKSYPTNVLLKVAFEYDYSLRANTPASFATISDGADKGALTLKAIKFFGQNNTLVSPPYRFDYAYGGLPGSSYNPNYHKSDYDYWGSYRYPTEAWLEHIHTPQQEKGTADLAAAWSLSNIKTPTGSEIFIDYETDDFFNINDLYLLSKGEKFYIDKQNSTGNIIKLNGWVPNGEQTRAIVIEKTEYDIIVIDSYTYIGGVRDILYKRVTLSQYESLGLFSIEDIDSNNLEVELDQNPPLNQDAGYSYMLMTVPNVVYGGGSRVKSVTTIDGNEQTKTLYTYKDGDVSSGVTSSLPADYVVHDGDSLFSDDFYEDEFGYDDVDGSILKEQYKEVFMNHKVSYGRPNPGVMYSKVQVINVDEDDLPISGMTEYEFYTAIDYPYRPDYSDDHLYIKDVSGIYGKPKATTYYEQVDIGGALHFRPLKRTSNLYAFSDQILDSANIHIDEDTLVDDVNKPLGVTQQKHFSTVAIEGEGSNNDFFRTVERTYLNVFGTGQTVQEFFYDGDNSTDDLTPTSTRSEKGKTIAYDANTGSALVSVQESSNANELLITRTVPAYWKYSDLIAKHMLTQTYQEIAYRVNGNIDDENLKDISLNDNDIKSSSITTWSNNWSGNANGIWRKNDSYSYVTGTPYLEFPDADPGAQSGVYPTVTDAFPWKKTSDIVQYDVFGHAIETVNEDGTYQSVLYDQDNMSLVLAVASNAKESEVNYFNFENGTSSGEFYTGQRSVSSFSETTPSADPIHGTKYKVGVWVKGSNATVNGVAVPGRNNTNWVFYQVTLHNNTNISGSGGHFDDLTMVPDYGSISYFAYDPLTWKVTAMTGPDHRTSFYEYDDTGRLMGVRDQDGKLLQTNEYAYGQMHYIDTEASDYALFDEITFTLNTVGPSVIAATPYTWSFGDGVQFQTTDTTVTHFYHKGGRYPVSVSFGDQNNITRRTTNTVTIVGDLSTSVSLFSAVNYGEPNGDHFYVVTLVSDTEGGLEPYSYEWYVQDHDQDPDDPQDWVEVAGQDGPNGEVNWPVTDTSHPEPFRIKLRVTDALGTSQEATYTVQRVESPE